MARASSKVPARGKTPPVRVNPRRLLEAGMRAYEMASNEVPVGQIALELGLSVAKTYELIEREERDALAAQASDRRAAVFLMRDRSIKTVLSYNAEIVERLCSSCDGTGMKGKRLCVPCKGNGYHYSEFYRAQARDAILRANDMLNKMWGTYAPEKLWLKAEVELPFLAEVLGVSDDELDNELADLQAPLRASDEAFRAAEEAAARRAIPQKTSGPVVS